jgi:hypothetical protein
MNDSAPLFSHPIESEPVKSSDDEQSSAPVDNPEFSHRN